MKKLSVCLTIFFLALFALCACGKTPADSTDHPTVNDPTVETAPTTETAPPVPETPASDFLYEENDDGGITILKYKGSDKNIVIPAMIDGKPVTAIGSPSKGSLGFLPVNSVVNSVILPDTVTVIDNDAFGGNPFLRSVTLSQNLKKIGNSAFYGCWRLQSVILPDSLTEIGNMAFGDCPSLSSVSLPQTLERLGNGAFKGCTALSSVTLSQALTEIGEETFSGCSALREIAIPASVSEIRHAAFNGSGLETVALSAGLEAIGAFAFDYTPLREIVLPETVKSIDAFAFAYCDFLETISLNQGLKTIGRGAFSADPSLTQITIPASVEEITETAFEGCKALKKVIFEGNAPDSYLDPNEDPFLPPITCNYMICYKKASSGFSYPTWNGYLTDILDADASSPLKGNPIRTEGDYEYFLLDNDTALLFRYHGTEPNVVIPDALGGKPVTEIGTKAFMDREDILSVRIPDSVKTIGASAFEHCPSLATVELPKGLLSIEKRAFCENDSLTDVVLPDSLTKLGCCAFYRCPKITRMSLPKSFSVIEDGVFAETGIKTFTFEEGLKEIGSSAFYDTLLEKTELPNSLERVKDSAFAECSLLGTVRFGDGLLSIGAYAFSNTAVTEIVLPEKLTEIGEFAFGSCGSLQSVTIGENLVSIGDMAFSYTKLTELILPASVRDVTDYSFYSCNSLKALKFEGDAPENFRNTDPYKTIESIPYTVYYHKNAKGFDSPEWKKVSTAIW